MPADVRRTLTASRGGKPGGEASRASYSRALSRIKAGLWIVTITWWLRRRACSQPLYHIASPFICSEYTMSSSTFLDQYEPLDIIGNGSFGIIRKVRRKTDGVVRLAKSVKVKTLMPVANRFSHERSWILREWVKGIESKLYLKCKPTIASFTIQISTTPAETSLKTFITSI